VTTASYVIALGAVAIGALTQGAVGFGFGMLTAPILALVDESLVPGSVLILAVIVAAIVAWQERGALDWRGIKWALLGRAVGTALGVLVVSWLSREQFAVVLGTSILVAVALSIAGWHVRPTPRTLVGAGTVSGVMGTLTSIGGPPMALVYQRERAAELRSTLAGFFLFGASLAILSLWASGELGGRQVVDGLLLLPGLVLGVVAARMLGRYLDHGWTRPAVLALCTAAAVALIVDAIA
jgi:uncharacterized membrane protein YfcA